MEAQNRHYNKEEKKPSVDSLCRVGETEHGLAAADELSPHGIAAITGSLNSVLVLIGATEEILHALSSGAPHEVLESWEVAGRGPAGLEACLDKLTADLVSHTLQLCKGNGRLGDTSIADGTGTANRFGIMCGEDNACRRVNTIAFDNICPLTSQDTGSNAVVTIIRGLLGVVKAMTGVGAEVSTTNQLHAELEATLSRHGQVAGDDLGHVLLIGLVGAEDGGALGVVLFGKVHGPVVNAILEGILFGVEQEANLSLSGQVADLVDSLVQVG